MISMKEIKPCTLALLALALLSVLAVRGALTLAGPWLLASGIALLACVVGLAIGLVDIVRTYRSRAVLFDILMKEMENPLELEEVCRREDKFINEIMGWCIHECACDTDNDDTADPTQEEIDRTIREDEGDPHEDSFHTSESVSYQIF